MRLLEIMRCLIIRLRRPLGRSRTLGAVTLSSHLPSNLLERRDLLRSGFVTIPP